MAELNVDKLFVSKVVQERDMPPDAASIPPEFIFDSEYRKAYEYVRRYYAEYGTVPTARVMAADCPKAPLSPVAEPWEDIIQRVQNNYLKGILNEHLDKIATSYENDAIPEAINFLGVLVSKVHTVIPNKRDVDATQTGEERLARYQERRDNPGMLVGVPSGYPTIDKATQGFQPGQLITLTGLAKVSKSAMAMTFAMAAQEYGKRVMYLTYEMTCDEQTNRLDAYRAGFNDNKLNSGELTNEDMENLRKSIHITEALPPMVFSEDTMTVTAIGAKMDVLEPDVVIVDGVYMMEDEHGENKGSPQALANIVAGLKFLAMRRKICIIAVTQSTPARTKGEVLNNDSIMGSRAFIQYSNTVIGIERIPEEKRIRKLKIIMSRSCAPCEVVVEFDFDTGTFQERSDYELEDGYGDSLNDEDYEAAF